MYAWLFILFIFFSLVVVGIKYDNIVPPFLKLVRRKKLNIWYLLLGLFFIFVSFLFLDEEPGFKNYSPGAQSSERWGFPVHNRFQFAVTFIFGLLSIVSAFVGKPEKKSHVNDGVYNKICISCGNIPKKGSDDELSCSQCGGKVEDISGVMDRHPEFLKNMKKSS